MTLVLREVLVVDAAVDLGVEPHRCDLVIGDDGLITDRTPPGTGAADVSVDAAGLYAVPGLIDCHVHLSFDPDRHPERSLPELSATQLHEMIVEHGEATLRAGVTTVRDLGSRADSVRRYARAVAAGQARGPRVQHAGPVLTAPQGHCYFVGDQIADDDALVRAVDAHLAAGDQWIKIMVTGGAMTSTSSPEIRQFDAARVAAVVRRAAAAGTPVAAHTLTAEGGSIAVAAGVRTVEHGVGMDSADLTAMSRRAQALVPVLSPSHRLLLADPDGTGEHVSRLRALIGVLQDTTRRAIELNVIVLAGTDAGCPAVPHGSLATEIGLLQEMGLTPAQALASATTGPARLLGLPGGGGLTRGAVGDVVLVEGDPRAHLRVLESPVGVISRGRVVRGLTVHNGGNAR